MTAGVEAGSNHLLKWLGGIGGLLGALAIVFQAGGFYSDAAATKTGAGDLKSEMRSGFEKVNTKIDKWPIDVARLNEMSEDLKAAKALGKSRNDDQDAKIRDLQEWTKSDREWLGRLDKAVACAVNGKRLAGCP